LLHFHKNPDTPIGYRTYMACLSSKMLSEFKTTANMTKILYSLIVASFATATGIKQQKKAKKIRA